VEKHGVRKSAVWPSKSEAQQWAKKVEAEIAAGITKPDRRTFADAVDRYQREVSANKRGEQWEALRLPKMVAYFPGALEDITAAHIAAWRDARLAKVSASTVLRELRLLRHVLRTAKNDWQWMEHEPTVGVRMPRHDPPRHQRWGWREIRQVLRYLGYRTGQQPTTKQQEVALAFLISLRTALRAGEVLQVKPGALNGRVLTLPRSKTSNRPEQVPLTRQGLRLCSQVQGWTITPASLDALFRKARDNTMVGDLRFHDARATALTMLARKVDVLVLSRISRHKNLKMLSEVYYRATAAEIAANL